MFEPALDLAAKARRHPLLWDEGGSVSSFSLFATMGILAVGGLAIDASNAHMIRNRLQIVAEAAALAAAQELPDEDAAEAKALEYVEKNLPPAQFGAASTFTDIRFGAWDPDSETFDDTSTEPSAVSVEVNRRVGEGGAISPLLLGMIGFDGFETGAQALASGACRPPVVLGYLLDYLFAFMDANKDANWQAATKGYIGDVVVDGIQADERTSGTTHFTGNIVTSDSNLDAWQGIVDDNGANATAQYGETALLATIESHFSAALAEIGSLAPTAGYTSVDPSAIGSLNFQNGSADVIVMDISDLDQITFRWEIAGDLEDLIIMRWDDDPDEPGYNGEVKFSSGGAIVPMGELTPTNFLSVAGNMNSSGGGSTPPELAPYLTATHEPVNGGGFFTGYWLSTGDPDKNYETSPHSNGIFVGGWWTSTTKFSITGGTAGVHVGPIEGTPLACRALSSDPVQLALVR